MDDELKAIQADLDSVLDRLAAYIHGNPESFYPTPTRRNADDYSNSKTVPAPWILDEPATSPREDAARIVFQYVCGRRQNAPYTNLMAAISEATFARFMRDWRGARLIETNGEKPGRLLAALDALCDWATSGGQPPEHHHMSALWLSAIAYHRRETEYFGQDAGLPLHPKRQVDRRAGDRWTAVLSVFSMHRQDPKAHPIGEALFELAGEPYGMSASVVKRAYYAPGTQKALQYLGDQFDAIDTDQFSQWSETGEN